MKSQSALETRIDKLERDINPVGTIKVSYCSDEKLTEIARDIIRLSDPDNEQDQYLVGLARQALSGG